jgi:(E)-4-hydroxy-3-methylbut-2-enyl-diphosphate synthase
VRFTAQDEREAFNLRNIRQSLTKQGYNTPLVADIHFNPNVADKAALFVEKVRINPGNYVDKTRKFKQVTWTDEAYADELQKIRARFIPFLKVCRENNTAIRIGVNHGSLSDRIMSRYGDTPEGMVESCMEFLRLCRSENFDKVVISIKASNTVVMIHTVRLLIRTMDTEDMYYPVHLGVTEAGEGEDGRIKSAVGIGALLVEGIGDTIRVSLSEDPEAEMPVARKLIDYITTLENHPPIHAAASPKYNPLHPVKRKSRVVAGIGGDNPPVVISDRTGFRWVADWDYSAEAGHLQSQRGVFPLFPVCKKDDINRCGAEAKFICMTCNDLNDDTIQLLKTDKQTVAVVSSSHIHYIGEVRAFMHRLLDADCDVPVIFQRKYNDMDVETVQIKAAIDFGALLTDGFGDGIMMRHTNSAVCDDTMLVNCMYNILQAARVRFSKTEHISCPGCGRTLFDLQKTIAQVKAATSHLTGLKIGIMGCIVNGPGEMADADYGYVGAGRGRISLYKGKTCVLKNIPEEEAVAKLLELINL